MRTYNLDGTISLALSCREYINAYTGPTMQKLRIALWTSIGILFRFVLPPALAIGIIGGLGIGAYVIGTAFVRTISDMSPESRATLLAALATPIVAILSVVISHLYARKRELAAAQNAPRIAFYKEFLKEYLDLLIRNTQEGAQGERQRPKLQKEMTDHVAKTAYNLMLWGDRNTVRAYLKMRDQAFRGEQTETGKGITAIVQQFEEFLFAIRRELGHSRRGMSQGDLLKLFITDIDKLLAR